MARSNLAPAAVGLLALMLVHVGVANAESGLAAQGRQSRSNPGVCRPLPNGHAVCRLSATVPRNGGVMVRGRRLIPLDELEAYVLLQELAEL